MAAAAVAGGLYLAGVFGPGAEPAAQVSPPAEATPAPAPAEDKSEEAASPAPAPEPEESVSETAAVAATDGNETENAPAEADKQPDPAPLTPPSFDVVRVEPDGSTLVAGQSAPASTVTILLDGAAMDSQVADGAGKFVSFLFLDPSDQIRVLTLRAVLDGQEVASSDQIILAPTPQAPAPDTTAVASAETQEDAPQAPSESGSVENEPATPTAEAQTAEAQTAEAQTDDAQKDEAQTDEAETSDVSPAQTEVAQADVTEAETAPAEDTAQDAPAVAEAASDAPIAPAEEPGEPAAEAPAPADQVAAAAEPTSEQAEPTDQTAPAEASGPVATSEAPPQPATPEPAAVTVLKATEDGVEVLQSASATQSDGRSQITLETISYGAEGEVQLAGRADKDAVIRIYLNNDPVSELTSGPDGRWRAVLNGIEPGVYTLRLDQVDGQGKVTSRIETPFKREAPEALRAAQPDPAPDTPEGTPSVAVVTVQKGDTLWAISRDSYGDGVLYVRLFEANRDRIRDPDLIYPGQVFSIPE